jgi:tetratricopeptide (TPR) repeat protein
MSDSSEYEAVKLLAQALCDRDQGEHERAIESLKRVIVICERSETGTCQYLLSAAHIVLYGIYKTQGRSEEASLCHQKAIKIGVRKEELENS